MAADLLLVDARGVGGVGDVDGDRQVGLHREGRGAGAEQADLLLHRGDRGEAGPRAQPRSWRGAAPRARRRRRAGCPSSARPAGRRPGAPARRRSPPGRRPGPARAASSRSAAPMSMCRPFSSTTFLRWSASSRWIGLRPTTPGTGPSLPRTSTRWPTRICGSQPPIGAEVEEALLVDVGDDEPDLVDVADDREQRRRLADPGDRGAEPVAGELGEGGRLAPDLRRRPLVSGGRGGAQQLVEQFRCLRHGRQYAESNTAPS